MQETHLALAQRLAARFSQLPEVEAIAIAGSQQTGLSGAASDIDFYVYTQQDLPAETRLRIGKEFAPVVEIVDFWGPGAEWDDPATGIHIDAIFFAARWMEDQVDRVLVRHEAWMGYTTAFWHTVRLSHILFDRSGWFAKLQQRAMQDYPEPLARAIVAQNYPVLRQLSHSSYLRQIEKAAARRDLVSLNHRTAAFLASYFDILFAVNRLPHPGEKRLLEHVKSRCTKLPPHCLDQITQLIQASANPDLPIAQIVNALVDELNVLLKQEGLMKS